MSNNNTPSSADDALKALHELSTAVRFASHGIKPTDDEAAEFKLALVAIRAFISGASDNQPQGELNATRLDTNDRATAGNRGARPDLQHIARDGHEPGSSGVESHPLRGGDGMVVGDITPSTRPGCAGVHLPLDASAASAPLGWLYDWTHSSALGKPDEHFTGFTTDETYARKHDNPRPVWGSPDAANAGEPAARTEFCWLVELFKPEGNSMGYYHTGFTDLSGQSRTTKNPHEARRYTKSHAEAIAAKLHHLAGVWKAVEHGFATPTGVAADACPKGEQKPEPTCIDKRQCWEPCGELGKSAAHARVLGAAQDHFADASKMIPAADDIAHIRAWFNAVQDLNPAFLDDRDRAVMARLCNEPQQAPAQDPEFVALMAMSEPEIDAELRALGIDPEVAARKAGEAIAEGIAQAKRHGYICRLCGKDTPHQHTPEEIVIFRNGVKFARLATPTGVAADEPNYKEWAETWHTTAMRLATIAGGNCAADPAEMIRSVQQALGVADDESTRAPDGRAASPRQRHKLVPVELTPEMVKADPYGMGYGRLHAIWSRLLAAVPSEDGAADALTHLRRLVSALDQPFRYPGEIERALAPARAYLAPPSGERPSAPAPEGEQR